MIKKSVLRYCQVAAIKNALNSSKYLMYSKGKLKTSLFLQAPEVLSWRILRDVELKADPPKYILHVQVLGVDR